MSGLISFESDRFGLLSGEGFPGFTDSSRAELVKGRPAIPAFENVLGEQRGIAILQLGFRPVLVDGGAFHQPSNVLNVAP